MSKSVPTASKQAMARRWGYVSAQVMVLKKHQQLVLPEDVSQVALVSGTVTLAQGREDATHISAFPDTVTIETALRHPMTLFAVTDVRIVLYRDG